MRWLCVAFLCVLAGPASPAQYNQKKVRRLVEPDDLLDVLSPVPIWMREVFYRLPEQLKVTFRLCSREIRDMIVIDLSQAQGPDRYRLLESVLKSIQKDWLEADGFQVEGRMARSSRNTTAQLTVATGNVSFPGNVSESPGANDTPDVPVGGGGRTPVVLTPLLTVPVRTLWDMMSELRSAGGATGLWRLALAGGDELRLDVIPSLNASETHALVPVYSADADDYRELVQVTFSPLEATLKQLMKQPDEVLRTMDMGEARRLSAELVTAAAVEHAGDVSITGPLVSAGAGNMSDTELETLVHSLVQRPVTDSELTLLAVLVQNHWPEETRTWNPTHLSLVAAQRCPLLPRLPVEALLPLDSDTVDALVAKCQPVWLQSPLPEPGLGRFVRLWKLKVAEKLGPLATWSSTALIEKSLLLAGALPEELATIQPSQQAAAITPLSFANLNRVQAQPVIDKLIASASNLTEASRLHELLRHLQPAQVRRLGALTTSLSKAAGWMFDTSRETAPFATHLQIRLLLNAATTGSNLTAEDVARLGPFFYTLPLSDVYNIYAAGLTLSPDLLQKISTRLLEPMTRRLLMLQFMAQDDGLCRDCLRGVPPELLGGMTDGMVTRLRRAGLLHGELITQLIPAADYMLAGKQAELMDAVRDELRRNISLSGQSDPEYPGSRQLWTLASPHDMKMLVPAIVRRMEALGDRLDDDSLVAEAAQYPRSVRTAVLEYLRNAQPNGTWTTENLLGRRPGQPRSAHGPWVYLTGLSCADVSAISPLDLVPISEEYERQLLATGESLMPLEVCICLKHRLDIYLRLRYAMLIHRDTQDGSEFGRESLKQTPLFQLPVTDVRALPACVLAQLPRAYLMALPRETRLIIWRKISLLTWPQILAHVSVQDNLDNYHWFAQQYMADLGVAAGISLKFQQLAQLNQLLHFVSSDVIARIAPVSFREWVYTLQTPEERLICRPDPAWSKVVVGAFGPAETWNMSTPYYLGSWVFALNSTQRRNISRAHLRYALDNHNRALFQLLPDTIGPNSGQPLTFLEACRQLGDTAYDLRLLFDAARLGGVVGIPRVRSRRRADPSVVIPAKDLRELNVSLSEALERTSVQDTSRTEAEVRVQHLLRELARESGQQQQQQQPGFDFWPAEGGRLRCEDLRSAGPAAVAVTAAELEEMAELDNLGTWSCLNALSALPWELGSTPLQEVWAAVQRVHGTSFGPDHVNHLGRLMTALSPDQLTQVVLTEQGQRISADAISVLGSYKWSPEQLQVLVTNTLGVTENPATSSVRLYSDPVYVTALGSLLCGFSPDQIRLLFDNQTRPNLYRDTSAALGARPYRCQQQAPLEVLAELAVETFGDTAGWDRGTVEAVGTAVAGLRRYQFEELRPAALRGLRPYSARLVAAAAMAKNLTPQQLASVSPQAARELLRQDGLSERQKDALKTALHGDRSIRAAPRNPPAVPAEPGATGGSTGAGPGATAALGVTPSPVPDGTPPAASSSSQDQTEEPQPTAEPSESDVSDVQGNATAHRSSKDAAVSQHSTAGLSALSLALVVWLHW